MAVRRLSDVTRVSFLRTGVPRIASRSWQYKTAFKTRRQWKRMGVNYWLIILGAAIVVLTLREVYRDLFHPTSSGSLSDVVAKGAFNLFRHIPKLLSDAGPLSVVLVIFVWVMAVCIGFALVYAAMPADYFKTEAAPQSGFLPMVYFSLEVITTLGLGDYTALPIGLGLLATFEALVGFAVLTASISSIVLLHQALARMRTLARKLSIAQRTKREFDVSFSSRADDLLAEFSAEVVRTRVDLIHLPLIYYFYAENEQSSLPKALQIAVGLAREGLSSSEPETHRAGALLLVALRDLAEVLRKRFLP
ncbi:MAG TPA: potassium channel family protein, partial [Bryobacteraceae bacterium]|nr:potassium channel family protein [Bryobacteraceae bacterium]